MKSFLIVLVGLAGLCRAENAFSINVKAAINVASDSFISFEFDFTDVMDLFLQTKSLGKLGLTAPAYIKLRGFSDWLKASDVYPSSSSVALMFQHLG
jgi:hypothetical protein